MKITIQELSKSFGGRDIFNNFSLEVDSGVRLCVCGPNGTGKSTLLRLLAGVEPPDGGRVILPRGCRLGFVEQELSEEALDTPLLTYVLDVLHDWNEFWAEWEDAARQKDEARLTQLMHRQAELEATHGYNPEHRAKAVLSGLGFAESKWLRTLRELSGGWRERAKLARVLTAGADVLLLDEPTNHLDMEAVEWLESFLMDFKGALVFVAHDRVFMDRVGTHVLYLGLSRPVFRKATYTQFLSLQEEYNAQREREAKALQDELARKMAFVERFRAKATKARQAGSRQKMAKKLEKELEDYRPEPKRKELNFTWPEAPHMEKVALAAADLAFHFPDGKQMWPPLTFTLYNGQRVALVGHNGCGKSTLLKLLAGTLERCGGNVVTAPQMRLGYYTQHQMDTLRPDTTVLGEIRRLSDPRTTEEELMSVLGLFLLGQEYFDRQVSKLSGGEKSRLVLPACSSSAATSCCWTNPPTIWTSKAARPWARPCKSSTAPCSWWPTTAGCSRRWAPRPGPWTRRASPSTPTSPATTRPAVPLWKTTAPAPGSTPPARPGSPTTRPAPTSPARSRSASSASRPNAATPCTRSSSPCSRNTPRWKASWKRP